MPETTGRETPPCTRQCVHVSVLDRDARQHILTTRFQQRQWPLKLQTTKQEKGEAKLGKSAPSKDSRSQVPQLHKTSQSSSKLEACLLVHPVKLASISLAEPSSNSRNLTPIKTLENFSQTKNLKSQEALNLSSGPLRPKKCHA